MLLTKTGQNEYDLSRKILRFIVHAISNSSPQQRFIRMQDRFTDPIPPAPLFLKLPQIFPAALLVLFVYLLSIIFLF